MEILRESKGWILFVGWTTMIGGALNLLTFPMGTIMGIIGVFAGSFLIKTVSSFKTSKIDHDAGVNLKIYFVLQAVMALVAIVLGGISLIAIFFS